MSLQATEATVVTFGKDNLIVRWVIFIRSPWSVYNISARVLHAPHPSPAGRPLALAGPAPVAQQGPASWSGRVNKALTH